MTLQNWKKLFEPHILQRGRAYYEEGAVETLYRDGDMVQATVLGSGRCQVEIELMRGEIADWSCDCPYGEDGTPCKHLAAVFYELETMGEETHTQPQKTSLEALVARLTPLGGKGAAAPPGPAG